MGHNYNIVHIHMDRKFIKESERFLSSNFSNKVIFINKDLENVDSQFFTIHKFSESDASVVDKVLAICANVDLVIFYSILPLSLSIIKELPNNVLIGWRFFGMELYSKMFDEVLTTTTLSILQKKSPLKIEIKKRLMRFYLNARRRKKINNPEAIIKRIDVFLGYYREEFEMLTKKFDYLPTTFIPLNFPLIEEGVLDNQDKRNNLIIGNSRNIYNNHLDILNFIAENYNPTLNHILPFSYGGNGNYSKAVLERAQTIPNHIILTKFLSKLEFENMYDSVKALIINAKRQSAVYNILLALRKGVKVYLNPHNTYYHFLKKNGFLVYTIDEFKMDYITGKISLTPEERILNYKILKNLGEKNTEEVFHQELLSFIKTMK